MRQIRTFAIHLLLWTTVGTIGRVAFLIAYLHLAEDKSLAAMANTLMHGLRLDIAIGGYVTLPAAIILGISIWKSGKVLKWIWRAYEMALATAMTLAFVANTGLYGYWGFPLDSTPLLYLRTSPHDAMASLTLWQTLAATAAWAISAAIMFAATELAMKPNVLFDPCNKRHHNRTAFTIGITLLAAILIIPIRGGVDTGTNHVGSVYFSTDMTLNHAAVNPVFSFMESSMNTKEIGSRYRFMEEEKADSIVAKMTYTTLRHDSVQYLKDGTERPDIVMIMLESFSKYIMQDAGNVSGVTPCLDSLKEEGMYFSRFYSSGVRTDKAMVSILSGLPAQPTMSIMVMPHKSARLPSIAKTLGDNGYSTTAYYGGDSNYSNMRSYIIGTGFQQLVCDSDFPRKQQTGKWGVPDGPLFDRTLRDIKQDKSGKPYFRTILTGSSHEPFDVPYESKFKEKELNAFAYADSCLGRFVRELSKLPSWENTLVAIVPDHMGAWPQQLDNYAPWRYEIPFIIMGGAIRLRTEITTVGCQTDIPATLLAMLGIDHGDFPFSRDMLDNDAPHFAFFTLNDGMGMADDSGCVIYDNPTLKAIHKEGMRTDALLLQAKAYLQKLYDHIDSL